MIHVRRKVLGVLIAVLAVGVAVMVPSFAAAQVGGTSEVPTAAALSGSQAPEVEQDGSLGCFANQICAYFGEYEAYLRDFECSSSGAKSMYPGHANSARNRCGNKTDWLRYNGNVIACMDPGGNRPNPGSFNEVFIAREYGAFC